MVTMLSVLQSFRCGRSRVPHTPHRKHDDAGGGGGDAAYMMVSIDRYSICTYSKGRASASLGFNAARKIVVE